jgi:nitroreductase
MRMADALETLRPLIRTRQYREFTSEPVSDDDLNAILEAARWSGSGGNSQPWHFVVVRDASTLRRMGEIGMPSTRSLNTAFAGIAIAMPNDPDSKVISAYDEGRVAERILVAATMLGIGAGIAWTREQWRAEMHELLGVGDDRSVRTIIALGHPTEGARGYRQAPGEARKPLDELVTWR